MPMYQQPRTVSLSNCFLHSLYKKFLRHTTNYKVCMYNLYIVPIVQANIHQGVAGLWRTWEEAELQQQSCSRVACTAAEMQQSCLHGSIDSCPKFPPLPLGIKPISHNLQPFQLTKWTHPWVILVNMVISVILGHEKTKIQNIIDLEMIDVFSVKTIIHSNNKKMGHLIWPLGV